MTTTDGPAAIRPWQERKIRLLSRREIEGLIAEGRHIFILDGRVIKADAWLRYHPGGDKAIKHMVGRDATDEINAYVVASLFVSTVTRHSSR